MLDDDMDDEAPLLTEQEFGAALDEEFRDLSTQWTEFADLLAEAAANGRRLQPASKRCSTSISPS